MSKQKFGYDLNDNSKKAPNKLVQKKEFSLSRDYEFSNLANETNSSKLGRPVKFKDKRYKATMPKRISPVVNLKLDILKPYVSELSSESGDISFNSVIDVLIETYISQKLSVTKEEFIRQEIENELNKIPK